MSGRTNVISDKEFRDKNKVLTTSNQQKHGEANNVLFSVRPETGSLMSVFSQSQGFLRLCSFFFDFHSFFPACRRHTCLSDWAISLSPLNKFPRQKNYS